MTHYPYYAPENPIEFTADDEIGLNRYLNGLRRADEAIGRLLASLEERGLDRSTLVVVVGDHGEAFGRHKQYGHAGRIFEANVHVPCMLINPVLFPGGREDDRVAGLLDLAPTVLQLLGEPRPESFQGRSLFEPTPGNSVHFFVPNAGKSSHFGYREGNLKLIYEPVQPVVEVYDLAADPEETINVAERHAAFVRRGKQRIAAWVKQQEAYYRGPMEGPGVEKTAAR
jgi:arylsulfatase A-like enzyme